MFAVHRDELNEGDLDQLEYYLQQRCLRDEVLPEVFSKTMRTLEESYVDIGLSQKFKLLRTEELYRG